MVGAGSTLSTTIAHVSRPDTTNAHTHTQYIIRVSDERAPGLHWTVYRRYSEFRSFRMRVEEAAAVNELCSHCGLLTKRTCFMRFPRRHLFRSLHEKVLEERRIGLNQFLNAVTKHARTCKDRVGCKTRALMDQFLMVSDVRYTFLDVNMMNETQDEVLKQQANEPRLSSLSSSSRSFSADEKRESNPAEDDDNDDNQVNGSQLLRPLHKASNGHLLSNANAAAFLSYSSVNSRERSSSNSRSSVRDLSSVVSSSSMDSRRSEDAPSSFGTSSFAPRSGNSSFANRHSDPGVLCRNDLLSFSARGGRRSETKPRARKVHLSSAAKRVKRLEEEEAGYSRPHSFQKPKRIVPMAAIAEVDLDVDSSPNEGEVNLCD